MINNTERDSGRGEGSVANDPVGGDSLPPYVNVDRGPQLLRLLTLLARFGMDPMAPALLERRCAALT